MSGQEKALSLLGGVLGGALAAVVASLAVVLDSWLRARHAHGGTP